MIFLIDFISPLTSFKERNWIKTHEILKCYTNLSLTTSYKKHFILTIAVTTKNPWIKISIINGLICTTKFLLIFFYFDMKTTYL